MEEEIEENTTFSIKIPWKIEEDWVTAITAKEKDFLLLGERIDFILVAKNKQETGESEDEKRRSKWKKDILNLNVHANFSGSQTPTDTSTVSKIPSKDFVGNREITCVPFSNYRNTSYEKREWHVVDDHTLVYPLSLTLENLPASSPKCQINVVLWTPQVPNPEYRGLDLLEAFIKYPLEKVLKQHNKIVRQVVHHKLPVLSPPCLKSRFFSIGEKHRLFLKVCNQFTEDLTIQDIQVLPNANENFHPLTLTLNNNDLVDIESKESLLYPGCITKLERQSCDFPLHLQPLENYNFVFEARVQGLSDDDIVMGQDTYLMALVTWFRQSSGTSSGPSSQHIVTHYKLPSVRLRKPGLIITAECQEKKVKMNQSFTVKYTIMNNLQDFLSLRLMWSPEKAVKDSRYKDNDNYRRNIDSVIQSVICHQPINHLGASKQGSTVVVNVDFMILNTGLYELGQHMKLNLQYSISPEPVLPSTRSNSISATSILAPNPPPPPQPMKEDTFGGRLANKAISLLPQGASLLGRRDSSGSTPQVSSSTTGTFSPLTLSPSHSAQVKLKQGTSLTSCDSGSSQTSAYSVAKASSLPRMLSGTQSFNSNRGITPQQVLKRNCQVFVIEEESLDR